MNKVDQFHQANFFGWIHACGRLIEKKQTRSRGESAHNFQAPLVSIRQPASLPVGVILEPKDIKEGKNFGANPRLLSLKSRTARERMNDTMAKTAVHCRADIVKNAKR